MAFNIDNFWRDLLRQDREALPAYFTPEAQILWHCTNERFTVEEFVRANCDYPGDWDGELQRRHWAGDTLITVTRVFSRDRAISFHVASFFQFSDGRIARMEEYWADDGPPPAWRQAMQIGEKIQ